MDTTTAAARIHIVMCCFLNRNYIEEATLSIRSIRHVGNFHGRITIITDFSDVHLDEYDVVVHVVSRLERADTAAGYRLKMLDILSWDPSDIFLYMDVDILCTRDMHSFMDHAVAVDDKLNVYGYDEVGLTQSSHPYPQYYAGSLTEDPVVRSQPAWCSGILLFRPHQIIADAFRETYNKYVDFISQNRSVLQSWEQRFLCLTFCTLQWYTISLNAFVSEESHTIPHHRKHTKPPGQCATFHHFNGYRSDKRKEMMREKLSHMLR